MTNPGQLRKFFIDVNTDLSTRSDFINHPYETLSKKYGIELDDQLAKDLELLVEKFKKKPPNGSLLCPTSAEMTQMITLIAFDAAPGADDDLLIT
jgi:hypothetical protein